MPKHAYLILAHNDVPLLQTLVRCLDDSRNDIFIHWDAKSGAVPSLETEQSRLKFLERRINVGWAGYSMVEAEYLLFKEAFAHGPHAYYHLISGVDLPIKSQDYIHAECARLNGTEFIAFAPATQAEIDYRVQHRFLFPEEFRTKNVWKRGLRRLYLRFQDLIHKKRTDLVVRKGSQWCSLTQEFVAYLIEQEALVKELFSHTFCPDELFVQTVCFHSPFAEKVKAARTEFEGNMRFIKWKDGTLLPLDDDDYPALLGSDRWFARKFSGSDSELITKIAHISR